MPALLTKKIQMTQIFDQSGNVVPVTVLWAGANTVLTVKTKAKDGYEAVQVGFDTKKAKRIAKPQLGHFKELGNFRYVKEFKFAGVEKLERGGTIDLSSFKEGEIVKVRGITKGKGFQGVVKRHGFAGGSRTHGQKHSEREPGSIGATWPQRVIKGMRMAGRMGGVKVSIKNLKIVKLDPENKLIYVSGAVPGARGALIEVIGK